MSFELEYRWQKLDIQRATRYAIDEHNRTYAPYNGIHAHSRMENYFLHRITVNYLRHNWTNYERLVSGHDPQSVEHHEIWGELCDQMIRDFPSLRAEVQRQAEQRNVVLDNADIRELEFA